MGIIVIIATDVIGKGRERSEQLPHMRVLACVV